MLKSGSSIVATLLSGTILFTGCKKDAPESFDSGQPQSKYSTTTHKTDTSAYEDSSNHTNNSFAHTIGNYQASDLGKALFENDTAKVNALIRNGESTDDVISDGVYQYDLLYFALVLNNLEMSRFVLSKRIYSTEKVYTEDAENPLTMASALEDKSNAVELSKALLENGAKVDGAGPSGGDYTKYPILIAVAKNNIELVRLFLEYGAKTDVLDESGMTPLALAESKGYSDIAALLSGTKEK